MKVPDGPKDYKPKDLKDSIPKDAPSTGAGSCGPEPADSYKDKLANAPGLRTPPKVEPKNDPPAPPAPPARTSGFTARRESGVASDGSHYTTVEITAPQGTNMESKVTDNGDGNVDAKQYNYNQVAESATTSVASGPPHKTHLVEAV